MGVLTSCAVHSYPSSQANSVLPMAEMDFSEIPHDRCSPALDGLYLSHEGAIDLVRGMRKVERDYQIQAIHQDTELRICQTKFEASQQELTQQAADKAWSLIGKLSIAGISTAAVITGIVLVIKAVGVVK